MSLVAITFCLIVYVCEQTSYWQCIPQC